MDTNAEFTGAGRGAAQQHLLPAVTQEVWVEERTLDDLLKDVRTMVLRAELKSIKRILASVSVESWCWRI